MISAKPREVDLTSRGLLVRSPSFHQQLAGLPPAREKVEDADHADHQPRQRAPEPEALHTHADRKAEQQAQPDAGDDPVDETGDEAQPGVADPVDQGKGRRPR